MGSGDARKQPNGMEVEAVTSPFARVEKILAPGDDYVWEVRLPLTKRAAVRYPAKEGADGLRDRLDAEFHSRVRPLVEALEVYMGKFGDCGSAYEKARKALEEFGGK